MTEHEIQNAILELLDKDEMYLVWRQNAGAVKVGRHYVRLGPKGAADISGIIRPDGRRLEIEVKRPGKKATPDQLKFGDQILKRGGIYIVTDSIQSLAHELGVWGYSIQCGRKWRAA